MTASYKRDLMEKQKNEMKQVFRKIGLDFVARKLFEGESSKDDPWSRFEKKIEHSSSSIRKKMTKEINWLKVMAESIQVMYPHLFKLHVRTQMDS